MSLADGRAAKVGRSDPQTDRGVQGAVQASTKSKGKSWVLSFTEGYGSNWIGEPCQAGCSFFVLNFSEALRAEKCGFFRSGNFITSSES